MAYTRVYKLDGRGENTVDILTRVDRDVIDLATRFAATTCRSPAQLREWLDTTPSRAACGSPADLPVDHLHASVVGVLQTETGELLSIIRRQQAENERLQILLTAAEADAAALAEDALA